MLGKMDKPTQTTKTGLLSDTWRREQQYSLVFLLRNSMDRGPWWAMVHGTAELEAAERLTNTIHKSVTQNGLRLNTQRLIL